MRTKLLDALLALSCTKDDLIDSGIGGTVMLLLHHPREDKSNREKCQKLLARWSRAALELSSDYSAVMPATYETTNDGGAAPATSLAGGVGVSNYVDNKSEERIEMHPLTGRVRRPRVNVPQPMRLEFNMLPASNVRCFGVVCFCSSTRVISV